MFSLGRKLAICGTAYPSLAVSLTRLSSPWVNYSLWLSHINCVPILLRNPAPETLTTFPGGALQLTSSLMCSSQPPSVHPGVVRFLLHSCGLPYKVSLVYLYRLVLIFICGLTSFGPQLPIFLQYVTDLSIYFASIAFINE